MTVDTSSKDFPSTANGLVAPFHESNGAIPSPGQCLRDEGTVEYRFSNRGEIVSRGKGSSGAVDSQSTAFSRLVQVTYPSKGPRASLHPDFCSSPSGMTDFSVTDDGFPNVVPFRQSGFFI